MKKNDIVNFQKISDKISASEIGQYVYCPVSWYLIRCGYKPTSPLLEIGIKKHNELGELINKIDLRIKYVKILKIISYTLFLLAILLFISEVVL